MLHHLVCSLEGDPVEDVFDAVDSALESAAFMIRPLARSVRASLWLCDLDHGGELRIVAGYRLNRRTMARFRQNINVDDGFAAFVARQARSSGFGRVVTSDLRRGRPADYRWADNRHSAARTASIVGIAIEVGTPDDRWLAVLCLSTERQSDGDVFAADRDEKEMRYFATVFGTILTYAAFSVVEDPASPASQATSDRGELLHRLYSRYEGR